MADFGLLGGLAEGLKAGFNSYRETKRDAEELALKRRLAKMQEIGGLADIYDKTGKEYTIDPEGNLVEGGSGLIGGGKSRRERAEQKEMEKLQDDARDRGETVSRDPQTGELVYGRMTVLPPSLESKREGEDLQRTQARLNIKKTQNEIDDKGKGRPVPAAEAVAAGSADAIIQNLENLRASMKSKPRGPTLGAALGKAQGLLGIGETGEQFRIVGSDRAATAKEVGKYLEGGKMTDKDQDLYENKVLPGDFDSDNVIDGKIDKAIEKVLLKQRSEKQGLKNFGFDVPDQQKLAPEIPIKPPQSIQRKIDPKSIPLKDRMKMQEEMSKIENSSDPKDQAAVARTKKLLGLE